MENLVHDAGQLVEGRGGDGGGRGGEHAEGADVRGVAKVRLWSEPVVADPEQHLVDQVRLKDLQAFELNQRTQGRSDQLLFKGALGERLEATVKGLEQHRCHDIAGVEEEAREDHASLQLVPLLVGSAIHRGADPLRDDSAQTLLVHATMLLVGQLLCELEQDATVVLLQVKVDSGGIGVGPTPGQRATQDEEGREDLVEHKLHQVHVAAVSLEDLGQTTKPPVDKACVLLDLPGPKVVLHQPAPMKHGRGLLRGADDVGAKVRLRKAHSLEHAALALGPQGAGSLRQHIQAQDHLGDPTNLPAQLGHAHILHDETVRAQLHDVHQRDADVVRQRRHGLRHAPEGHAAVPQDVLFGLEELHNAHDLAEQRPKETPVAENVHGLLPQEINPLHDHDLRLEFGKLLQQPVRYLVKTVVNLDRQAAELLLDLLDNLMRPPGEGRGARERALAITARVVRPAPLAGEGLGVAAADRDLRCRIPFDEGILDPIPMRHGPFFVDDIRILILIIILPLGKRFVLGLRLRGDRCRGSPAFGRPLRNRLRLRRRVLIGRSDVDFDLHRAGPRGSRRLGGADGAVPLAAVCTVAAQAPLLAVREEVILGIAEPRPQVRVDERDILPARLVQPFADLERDALVLQSR
mmetsp:Transcript_31492/g.104365  ORF Transcript_31492/g.104365 Transcript_31492/m.104365 type:complete len:636 (+) Transcript_31492:334-2241(+)